MSFCRSEISKQDFYKLYTLRSLCNALSNHKEVGLLQFHPCPGPLVAVLFLFLQAWSWQEIHLAEIVWFAYSFIPAKLQAPRGPKPLTVSGTPSISCFKFTHLLTLQVHFL